MHTGREDISGISDTVSTEQMLFARDRRVERQHELLAQYSLPLISFSMNIAGPVKNSSLIRRAFKLGSRMLTDRLSLFNAPVLHSETVDEVTGCEGLYVVDLPPQKIKEITLSVEESCPAGRLFDIDVITVEGVKIARPELRKCLLCDKPALVCGRSRTHTVAQLQEVTKKLLTEFLDRHDARVAASLAIRSLLYEVCVSPKPGLVDRGNSGSHDDMDIYTFMSSASSLFPCFESCVLTGRATAECPANETLDALRRDGLAAESAMRHATGNINTHKGAIYSMGLLCGALGRIKAEDWTDPERVTAEVSAITAGSVERELASVKGDNYQTAGQRIYAQYGISGIRGEVESGFPTVLKYGLPALEAGLCADPKHISEAGYTYSEDLAGSAALLAMITRAADTNMIARGGIDLHAKAVSAVERILNGDDYPAKAEVDALDRSFIEKHLSPGGCADLLSICWMLHFLKVEDLI